MSKKAEMEAALKIYNKRNQIIGEIIPENSLGIQAHRINMPQQSWVQARCGLRELEKKIKTITGIVVEVR